ncbi:alpha-(1,3)-fucosyltransferase C [Eurytemora carolleeae]|uniref:alpha-(1,3)-fucosyltransferase C n=1 Tax=Eurytemora carolleeae TaxID=1294199 RepID=UPI000C7715E8|nr:alpha-(1,3)-fucosyltransferase C [Eurytemora carolleeae]|eukprot:XP_023348837.1 alpha-(1,3)-fucosyltransferase C-like [Eurytemora affinis]
MKTGMSIIFILNFLVFVFQKPKYILYYNQFWNSDNFGYRFGKSPFIVNNCSVNNCFITNNRLLLPAIEDFDMIIFHTGGVEVLKKRNPKQFYVFFSLECPIHAAINGYEERYRSFFNLTMTY